VGVDIQGHFTGERTYTGYDANFNSIDKTIDPISNVTFGIHTAIPWLQSAQCHFVINNVLDRDISFFPDYPEPGRSITAGVSVNF
jgi:outer membrane cobalamin receptor